jgi:Transposase/Transglycosylase SLT domain
MTQYKRLGIDTSKAMFTLHGIDQQDRPVLQINLRRAQMTPFFRQLPPTAIALEACGASHYWAHELTALGHTLRLIPPQYVKPHVKRGKNDRNDAEAICEAAGRPGMHFVRVKSVTQQAQGMVLKVRETLIGQRTAPINTVRGHAAEFGIIAGKGAGKIVPLLSAIEQEAGLSRDWGDYTASTMTGAQPGSRLKQQRSPANTAPNQRTSAGDHRVGHIASAPIPPISGQSPLCAACTSSSYSTRWDGRRGYDGHGDYGYDVAASNAEARGYLEIAARSYPAPGDVDDPWGPYIREAAYRFQIPELLVRAVMRQESGGRLYDANDSLITSSVGAMGLMQVMPQTYDILRGLVQNWGSGGNSGWRA